MGRTHFCTFLTFLTALKEAFEAKDDVFIFWLLYSRSRGPELETVRDLENPDPEPTKNQLFSAPVLKSTKKNGKCFLFSCSHPRRFCRQTGKGKNIF